MRTICGNRSEQKYVHCNPYKPVYFGERGLNNQKIKKRTRTPPELFFRAGRLAAALLTKKWHMVRCGGNRIGDC